MPKPTTGTTDRSWSPRMWLGCDFFAWLRIMTRGKFRFHPSYAHMGLVAACTSFGHTVLKYVQNALFRRRIARTRIENAPVFIVGHWRTGTTHLHEMMILDDRHAYPNTYQCMVPNHFLLTERTCKRPLLFMLPPRRPMDNMEVGWDRPQEDEFAMCMLGQPSPYLDLVFPNGPALMRGSLDLEGLPRWQKREWKRTFLYFLKSLTLKDPRRLILKSPPHSCRIPTLLEMFPDARFVHIVRNPYAVFPSTVKLWKSLAEKQGVQIPHHQKVEEKVLGTFSHMYAKLEEGKRLVAPSRFHELKYEDLVADPLGQMQTLYERLQFGGFEQFRPKLAAYLDQHANYERNHFQLSPAQRQLVTQRWGHVIRRYGYPIDPHGEIPIERAPQAIVADPASMPADSTRYPGSGRVATPMTTEQHASVG